MCGIGGYVGRNQHELLGWKEYCTDVLKHRGPDGKGIWSDKFCTLAHTRLAILDTTESSTQPMVSKCGRYVITYNGEIYNYKELRGYLASKGVQCSTEGDTEILVELWSLEKEECLNKLNGMFAFGVWDRKKEELVLVRDYAGMKPLFYMVREGLFAFSSEIKALMRICTRIEVPEPQYIIECLTYLWKPGTDTFHDEINILGPACLAKITKDGSVETKTWWEPAMNKGGDRTKDKLTIEVVEEVLAAAVKSQMVADVEVGAFLSGGLDSSLVVNYARNVNKELKCFTLATDGATDNGFEDDLPYARKVAEHLDLDLIEVCVTAEDLISEIRRCISFMDTPVADPAVLAVSQIARCARQQGIKVMLSGNAGDDLFTGYRRHRALMYYNGIRRLPNICRNSMNRATKLLGKETSYGRRLSRLVEVAAGSEDFLAYFKWHNEETVRAVLSESMRSGIRDWSCMRGISDHLGKMKGLKSDMERMLAIEQRYFLADHNLYYTDIMGMSEGVEIRIPFLDKKLLELSWRIDDSLKQKGNCQKWILKEFAKRHLPKEVVYRRKTGFGLPLKSWITLIRDDIEERLSKQEIEKQGLFDSNAIEISLQKYHEGDSSLTYLIWSIYCTTLWWDEISRRF